MKTLPEYITAIDRTLAEILDTYRQPAELYSPIQYLFDGGGKRIRPLLVLLASEVVGGNAQGSMQAAVAAELLHNFTLVHDDIMDRSALRRGRPTVHMQYDVNTAILSGDVMLGLGMKLLAQSTGTINQPSNVYQLYAQGFIDVCEGQALDMSFANRNDITVDEYFRMIELKTARLLEMCVAIGAMIGGGEASHIQALRTYARDLGVAFQLQDDILDLEGSAEFGKTAGGDLVEGKRTWLVLRARDIVKHNNHPLQTTVAEFFSNNGITANRVPAMRACLDELGVVSEARQIVQRLTDEAFAHLNILPDNPARTLLHSLSMQLMKRNS